MSSRLSGKVCIITGTGGSIGRAAAEDISDKEWDRDRREEVDLVFYLTRAAWPHLKTSHGVIVNTGSLNGLLSFKTLPSWPIRRPRQA